MLEWVTVSYSEGLPTPGAEPVSLAPPVDSRFFTTVPPGDPLH